MRTISAKGHRRHRAPALALLALLWVFVQGCATPVPRGDRPFEFGRDTFAFANGLVWVYGFDADGKWRSQRREPAADYTHHCFVVARAAKQFFAHARFDPGAPPADAESCRRLIRAVVRRSPRKASPPGDRVVIPGFASLREFSAAHEALFKAECGGASESYFQRGHWRMVFPFNSEHQTDVAEQLAAAVRANHAPVVHVVRFPELSINHALVVFAARETGRAVEFSVYDPNNPAAPVTLAFDRATRRFELPRNDYFIGGRVDVYEVYHRWNF